MTEHELHVIINGLGENCQVSVYSYSTGESLYCGSMQGFRYWLDDIQNGYNSIE